MVTLENSLKLALVDETLCTGCGVCSTVCINGAPSLAPVSQDQIRAMLEVVGG
jgi:heterodisulfide reductase subunit A-like polyferredoxin